MTHLSSTPSWCNVFLSLWIGMKNLIKPLVGLFSASWISCSFVGPQDRLKLQNWIQAMMPFLYLSINVKGWSLRFHVALCDFPAFIWHMAYEAKTGTTSEPPRLSQVLANCSAGLTSSQGGMNTFSSFARRPHQAATSSSIKMKRCGTLKPCMAANKSSPVTYESHRFQLRLQGFFFLENDHEMHHQQHNDEWGEYSLSCYIESQIYKTLINRYIIYCSSFN